MSKFNLDFDDINVRALTYAEEIFDVIGLEGEVQRNEYVCINPCREDSDLGSFKFNLDTGAWADFAAMEDDAKGVGVISYVKYVKGSTIKEAATVLKKWLDKREQLPSVEHAPAKTKKTVPETDLTIVQPVPADAPKPEFWFGEKLGKPSMGFTYKDVSGNLLGYILRFDLADGKKDIRPCTLWKDKSGNMEWHLKGFLVPRPLYNLHLLAAQPDAPVLIVEGEKAANAAMKLFPDHVVTSVMGGANAVDKADLSPLYGREVKIWPDYDDPGRKYAKDIVERLQAADGTTQVSVMKPLMYMPDGQFRERCGLIPEGYDAADAQDEGWTADLIKQLPVDIFQLVEKPGEEVRFDDFLVNDKGVHIIKQGEEIGDEYYIRIASRIDVVALTRDKNSKNWGKLIVLKDLDGHVHKWAMPSEMLSGGEMYRQALLNMGADIPTDKNEKELLTRYLSASKPEARALCVNSIGWHGNVFVFPDKSYGQSDEEVILQTTNALKVSPYDIRGTIDEWKDHVGSKCIGNSRMILAVCISLAGPFLDTLKLENGGFHFRGQSSSGKTKSLSVAASIYGSKAMVRVWRATGNAVESLAREHNDTVLLLDELGQVEPQDAGDIAYTLGNGQSKARANVNGDAREVATWRLLFISTGEIGLADHVAAGGGRIRAGQEIRMLDIPSDANAGMGVFENIHGAANAAQFADSLQTLSEAYYGSPADVLLSRITQPGEIDRAANFIRHVQAQFVQQYVPVNAHGQVTRAASRFGAVAGVGEYCISIGILPWEAGHAKWGILQCYSAWLDSRGDNSASEEIRALAQVREYLERNGESRFPVMQVGIEDNVGQHTINRTGFRQILDDASTEYWVLPEMFRTEICNGFDPKLVTRVLRERGHLEVDGAGKTSINKKLPGIGSQRVYIIKPTLMQSGEVG